MTSQQTANSTACTPEQIASRGSRRPVNLALQGGGAHGAFAWGVLDRLLEDDRLALDAVSATSAGAVNAVAMAYGASLGGAEGARTKLDELWQEVSRAGAVWSPPGSSSIPAALTVASFRADGLTIHYPFIPWLAIMMLGWVFGRHLIRYAGGGSRVSGRAVLWIAGIAALGVFVVVRYLAGYGDMFLHRADGSWQQWLHVSKYPPSLTYYGLELGILFVARHPECELKRTPAVPLHQDAESFAVALLSAGQDGCCIARVHPNSLDGLVGEGVRAVS